MTLCVTMNTIALAMDSHDITQQTKTILDLFNNIFTAVFVMEFLIKIVGLGVKSKRNEPESLEYVRDRLNLMDFVVVVLSIVEISIFSKSQSTFTAFRTIRIFR